MLVLHAFLVIFLVCVPLLVDARQRRLEDVVRTRWNLTRIRISEQGYNRHRVKASPDSHLSFSLHILCLIHSATLPPPHKFTIPKPLSFPQLLHYHILPLPLWSTTLIIKSPTPLYTNYLIKLIINDFIYIIMGTNVISIYNIWWILWYICYELYDMDNLRIGMLIELAK
jgi:hypothetical protein